MNCISVTYFSPSRLVLRLEDRLHEVPAQIMDRHRQWTEEGATETVDDDSMKSSSNDTVRK